MTLEIYKLSLFLISVSIGIQFVEVSGIVPGASGNYYELNGVLTTISGGVSYMFGNTVPNDLSYLALSLATFGLLVFTLGVMLAIFWYGYIMGSWYLAHLPLTLELKAGFLILLAILYIAGYQQYKANVSLKQF